MQYGIIDVGSNTIRLAVYEKQNGEFQQTYNLPDYAGLISYVRDGVLLPEGEEKLINALNHMQDVCKESGCSRIKVFATASLRDVANREELCRRVSERTGLSMEIISGEIEARYDYLGLQSAYHAYTGVAFDLGGGSCQILCFEYGTVVEHASFPIGSRRLYDRYVHGVLPTDEEAEKLRKEVRIYLSELGIAKNMGCKTVYAMGGAARAALTLLRRTGGKQGEQILADELDKLQLLPETLLKKLVPERLTTIVPALITMKEICRYLQCDTIHVTDCGVREGVLSELEQNEL